MCVCVCVCVCTEYVDGAVPVEVDASDARRGDSFDAVGVDQRASGTSNRSSPVAGMDTAA